MCEPAVKIYCAKYWYRGKYRVLGAWRCVVRDADVCSHPRKKGLPSEDLEIKDELASEGWEEGWVRENTGTKV